MSRVPIRPLLAALTLAGPTLAHAQVMPPTNPAASYTKDDFLVRLEVKDDKGNWILPTPIEAQYYFNRARCECETPVAIRVDMTQTGITKTRATNLEGILRLYAGSTSCVAGTLTARPVNMMGCELLAELPTLSDLAKNPSRTETTVGKLFRSGTPPAGKGCSARFQQPVLMWIDSDRNNDPDQGVTDASAPSLPIDFDGEAPSPPSNIEVTPGNEALTVSWSRSSVPMGLAGSLVFCSRADLPVFPEPNPFFNPKVFSTHHHLCPTKVVQPATVAAISSAQTATPATPLLQPDAFGGLHQRFLCSDLITTGSDYRIKILQNGIKYQVGVVAVDTHGNVSPIDTTYVQAPVPTLDFYRGYREAGGEASGCAYGRGTTPGAGALVALLALALVRRHGRRR